MEKIKANELRIGNLIEKYCPDADSSETIIVDGELIEHIHYTELYPNDPEERIRHQKFFYPIPITEQWLIDAGFVHETISQRGNKIYRKQAPEMKFDLEVINNNFFFGNRQIIYVHDLQNGYHWHSGEELILNR